MVAGVDVGGRRKGFHVAVVEGRRLVALERCATVADVLACLTPHKPSLIGVDSPKTTAPAGGTVREDERALAREVCRIRWTPERARLDGNPYYEWVVHGLELYGALLGHATAEVFPTASWTIWAGPRGGRGRGEWSTAALATRHVRGLPARRLSQDDRDAIGAALTVAGPTRAFGEILVPD